MIRTLLVRGLLLGLLAGLVAGAFAFAVGEPRIDDAIALLGLGDELLRGGLRGVVALGVLPVGLLAPGRQAGDVSARALGGAVAVGDHGARGGGGSGMSVDCCGTDAASCNHDQR